MNENEEDKKRELTGLVIDCREIVIKKKQYDGLKLCVSESVNLIWEWHKKEIAKLKADNLRLVEVLKELEWSWDVGIKYCNMCGENEDDGHRQDCELKEALKLVEDTTDHTEKGE